MGFPRGPTPGRSIQRGATRAHWTAPDTIAIPGQTDWAMTELVVLHEYAHHVAWHLFGTTGHDDAFCEVMRGLVSDAISPTAGVILLAAYDQTGARQRPVRPERRAPSVALSVDRGGASSIYAGAPRCDG